MEKELRIEYSDREVTAWDGMKLMKDLVDRTGLNYYRLKAVGLRA